jgi:hydrogenase maturation protease
MSARTHSNPAASDAARANPPFLVIGYGNKLRGDDGVGQHVAREIEAQGWRGARAMAVHQLTPELAEPISAARHVCFVDARADGIGGVVCGSVQPLNGPVDGSTHAFGPAELLSLAQIAYGHCPSATLVTIPGASFDLSETLSTAALDGAAIAVRLIAAQAAATAQA